jgi:hypothetical protein
MCADLPRSPGHVFYDRLQSVLIKGGFDRFVEKLCAYYAAGPGRKSIPPGRYFRMHLVVYFEGIQSERGLAFSGSTERIGWLSLEDADRRAENKRSVQLKR